MSYTVERAHDLAISVLIFLTDRPEALAGFLGQTGLAPADLRTRANDPDLLLNVLDYLTQDDALVLDAADSLNLRPTEFMAARTALAGPGSHGWDVD